MGLEHAIHFWHAAGSACSLCAPSLVAALLFAGVVHAQQAPFTLDAALQSATDQSASMQAAQASVRASSEAAVKAGQLPDPMLAAGIDNLPINGSQGFTIGQDFMTMRRVGIQQEWVSGTKRQLRSALADETVGRERAGYLMQLANVRQQTAAAWLNAVYAKQALALQQALLDHMHHELAATKASYRGAKVGAADAVQAQAMLAQTQDQVLKAQQTYQTALIGLSRWTAVPVSDVTGEPPRLNPSYPCCRRMSCAFHSPHSSPHPTTSRWPRRIRPSPAASAVQTGRGQSRTSNAAGRIRTWCRSASPSRCR